jgi:hypothetical protein
MTCERCLMDTATAEHGIGLCPFVARSQANAVENVTWPGGKTFENLGHEPVTFYHRTEYDKYLRNHNLEPFVRHIDGSPHTRSWATMDPYTLNAAKELVARAGKATNDPPPQTWVASMTVTVSDAPDAPLRVRMG